MTGSIHFLFFCLLTVVSSEVRLNQSADDIDPLKQTQDEAEASDQSKRTLFDQDNIYGLEKHVRIHPYGYKYLLGYRPVKLQFVPVAKPLYVKPVQWKVPKLHYSVKPVVSLLPPKTVPVYKPTNQFRNHWQFGKLPVNVPPSVALKPWQQEGWTPFTKDSKPFVPSAPLPQPENALISTPPSQSPIIPIIPTVPTASVPVFSQGHPVFIRPKPLVPVAPVPPVFPVHPVPPPVHPTVNLQPVHSAHGVHFDVVGRPLVPINYLPGKLDLPVPDLGVLPLGSTVPIQASLQVHGHPHFVPKVHQQVVVPEQHFLPRLPFPGGLIHQGQFPIHAHAGLTPIAQPVQPILPHPVQPVQPILPHPVQPVQHILPHPVQPVQPILPHSVQPVQPILPQPLHPPISADFPLVSQPVQPPLPQSFPQPHIHVTSQQGAVEHPVQQQPVHNYQYFAQHGHAQFHQETAPLPADQNYQQHSHDYEQFDQQQGVQEAPGFYQPGETDLQIPDYLPEHPHIRQSFVPSQEDSNVDPYSRK